MKYVSLGCAHQFIVCLRDNTPQTEKRKSTNLNK